MIACLQGELLYKTNEAVIINVGGVGYEIFFHAAGHHRLPGKGDEVFFNTVTVVREDSITLYGFLERDEKELFLLLTSVSGIGPRIAMNIAAAITPADMAHAVASEDIYRLTQLPGIGKKTAERLCLELKDKVPALGFLQGRVAETSPAAAGNQVVEDVVSALVNLGYSPASARESLKAIRQDLGAEHFAALALEELLRRALRALA